MILKFIILATVCWTMDGVERCGQQLRFDLSDASECKRLAYDSGKAFKEGIVKIGGSMTEYRVHCIAIDNEGYNVDGSFKISYNIL